MSSRDDDTDKRQRTVAELLAQHGENARQDDEAPRGRRRRAEDAAEDTAPQAIIERVRGGTGTDMPPAGHSVNGHPKPAGQQPTPQQQPQQPGNQAQEQNRRAAQAQAQAQTQQHPPVQPPQAPQQPQPQQGQQTQQNQGPAVPARRTAEGASPAKSPTRTIPPIGEPEPAGDGFPEPPEYDDYSDPAKYNPPPPLPEDAPKPQRGSLTARLAGAPPEPLTQQMQAVSDDQAPAEQPSAMEQTGFYTPNFDDEQDEDDLPGEQTAYHQSLDDDEDYEDYAEDDYLDGDEYEAEDYADEDEYEDYEDEPRGAREWMTLLGLIAAGVVGGGLVWLAFDWLWSTSKLVAAIGVVVVTLAIVFLVRKAWRARDVQTTVFSVIVGLIVTATPAALQYLGS